METIRSVGVAILLIAAALHRGGAQNVSLRGAKCALIPEPGIALLPPMDIKRAKTDGAYCPVVVNFTARVHVANLPQYPQAMLDNETSGEVLLQFVFAASGQVDTSRVVILRSTDPQFESAVRSAMVRWAGEPALIGDGAVDQWLAMDVRFLPRGCSPANPPVVASSAMLCIGPPRKR